MPSQSSGPSAEIAESGRIEIAAGDLATTLESRKPHSLKKSPPSVTVSIDPMMSRGRSPTPCAERRRPSTTRSRARVTTIGDQHRESSLSALQSRYRYKKVIFEYINYVFAPLFFTE